MSVWKSDEKLFSFASLISTSKIVLSEKEYQAFDRVFHHQMKHLEVRQKYSAARRIFNSLLSVSSSQQGSFLHKHARPLNKRCAWRLTTGFSIIKMARLKVIIAIILLVGLGECARDLTKCVVCKKTSNMILTKAK